MFPDLGLALGSVLWGIVVQVVGYDVMYLLAILPTLVSLLVYLLFAHKTKHVVGNCGNISWMGEKFLRKLTWAPF